MGFLEDFHLGREQERNYEEKQKTRQLSKQKRVPPNRLAVGAGVAYEILKMDKKIQTLRETIDKAVKGITPIFLIVIDDIKGILTRVFRMKDYDPNTSFYNWQVKEKFSEIGRRLKK
jgi:hypothetical protein